MARQIFQRERHNWLRPEASAGHASQCVGQLKREGHVMEATQFAEQARVQVFATAGATKDRTQSAKRCDCASRAPTVHHSGGATRRNEMDLKREIQPWPNFSKAPGVTK